MPARRVVSAVALSVIASVLPVSVVAQSDSSAQGMLVRWSSSVVRPYTESASLAHDRSPLPPNLVVAGIYKPIVEAMRAGSPTFRRQCARLASEPMLVVAIRSEPPPAFDRSLAATRIGRRQSGLMQADVRVAISTRTPELIAHEFEHVLEQLDGVDLQAMSRLPASGVHACDRPGAATFETARAIATGLRVARELARE